MKYGAIIIETRIIPEIREIIDSHMQYLPFDLVVYCSHFNEHLFKGLTSIIIPHINSLNDVNRLMTNPLFWEGVPFDKVLNFQSDSRILRPGIEEFYEWDWVGAPWKFQDHGGNGGLSWRNVEAMENICKLVPYSPSYGYEDVYFCNAMKNSDYKLAPRDVCKKFSCETIFELGTLGCHAIENYFPDRAHEIYNQYCDK